MVFSSFFGLKESEEPAGRVNVKETTRLAGDGLGKQSGQEFQQGKNIYGGTSQSEAEVRILKTVSKGSLHASDDGKKNFDVTY